MVQHPAPFNPKTDTLTLNHLFPQPSVLCSKRWPNQIFPADSQRDAPQSSVASLHLKV